MSASQNQWRASRKKDNCAPKKNTDASKRRFARNSHAHQKVGTTRSYDCNYTGGRLLYCGVLRSQQEEVVAGGLVAGVAGAEAARRLAAVVHARAAPGSAVRSRRSRPARCRRCCRPRSHPSRWTSRWCWSSWWLSSGWLSSRWSRSGSCLAPGGAAGLGRCLEACRPGGCLGRRGRGVAAASAARGGSGRKRGGHERDGEPPPAGGVGPPLGAPCVCAS